VTEILHRIATLIFKNAFVGHRVKSDDAARWNRDHRLRFAVRQVSPTDRLLRGRNIVATRGETRLRW